MVRRAGGLTGVGLDERTERRLLMAIAALTLATGGVQAASPSTSLRFLDASQDPGARHFFGTVGMFMVVTGGSLLDGLARDTGDPGPPLWAAAQKLGASGAVGLGVRRGVFSPVALAVAGFDLLSGLLALDYWRRTRR